MRGMVKLALCCAGMASVASGQGAITYSWTVSDTGNGDGVLEPGEHALLTLWALMDPGAVGFAGSIFEIAGDNEEWQAGSIVRYDNRLDQLSDDGNLQDDDAITNIEAFQLPPAFNPDFEASNPIALYELEWAPYRYGWYHIEFWTQNHLNNDVYVDDFGTSVSYQGIPAHGVMALIPAPGAAPALLAAGLSGLIRRSCR